MKSSYDFIKETWQNIDKKSMKEKTDAWRAGPSTVRVDRPSKIDRARALGYRAKQGFVIVRTRIRKGGRKRRTIRKGRRPTNVGIVNFTTSLSKQSISEKRASKSFPNLEVLNSYYIGEDGRNKYYEIIMVDKNHAAIKADKKINWIVSKRGRAKRGLTSSSRKNRGL